MANEPPSPGLTRVGAQNVGTGELPPSRRLTRRQSSNAWRNVAILLATVLSSPSVAS
jgi:hypothetical protein